IREDDHGRVLERLAVGVEGELGLLAVGAACEPSDAIDDVRSFAQEIKLRRPGRDGRLAAGDIGRGALLNRLKRLPYGRWRLEETVEQFAWRQRAGSGGARRRA